MLFRVLTLFPEMFRDFKKESIIGRAITTKKVKIDLVNIRDFSDNKHGKVDDSPFGGGEGMVMQCQPIFAAMGSIGKLGVLGDLGVLGKSHPKYPKNPNPPKTRCIYLSPIGKKFTQRTAERLGKYDEIVLLCGRYEGVDQRVIDTLVDEEISIGDYVLTGGELPAMVLMDSVIRLIPGVLGKEGSHHYDSFSKAFDGKKEYPHYTKPADFQGMRVPEVLLSGNHKLIEEWKRKHLR